MKYRIRETFSGGPASIYYLEQSKDGKDKWEEVPCAPRFYTYIQSREWLDALTKPKQPDVIHPYP